MRHLCIANSHAGARFNSKTLGHPMSHYRVIHNGVNTDTFLPLDKYESRRQFGLPIDHFWVGIFASFKARKNHEMLLRAASKLVTLDSDIRFLFVGDQLADGRKGSDLYFQKIMNEITVLGISSFFTFLGNQLDVNAIYPCCNVTVLTSRIEGTPNAALESMACGVPVIATDVSDNSRIVPYRRAGFVIPLDDEDALVSAIRTLKSDDHLRNDMSTFSREWVSSEFSIEKYAGRTAAAYREYLR